MELETAILGRRSVRKFSKRKVKLSVARRIIDLARWAPTACDRQAFRFIIVTGEYRKKLVSIRAASFIEDAPMGILVLYSNRTENMEYSDHIQSASACIQNMLLLAHSMGLGACWVCHLPKKEQMRRLFAIPEDYDPVAYVAMGYYEKPPGAPPRRQKLDDIVSCNGFDFPREAPVREISVPYPVKRAFRMLPFRVRKMLKPRDYWCRRCGRLTRNCRCNGDKD